MRLPSIIFLGALLCLSASQVKAQYQANGNAVQTSCNCYRLTAAQDNQSGSVWNVNQIDLNNPFNFAFDVYLGCSDGGADGMAFVLQPLSVNAGSVGGGIGYAGITPSLAVEMDTYQNNTDPSYDHMALQTGGSVSHGTGNTLAGPIQTSASTGNVEDCGWHLLQISWDPAAQTFTVWFDGVQRLNYVGNIISVFGGNPMVYWGFTAATGGANNLHQFCNTIDPNFNISPASQCLGQPVQFNNTSIVSTGQVSGFVWDFGDGTSGTGPSPSHTYTTANTFTAALTITSEGCSETYSTSVVINPIPIANVGVDVPICLGDAVQITPSNIDPNAYYSWSPATGVSNPNVPNPMIQTATTTNYVMTVTSVNGCQASDDINIIVSQPPVADAGDDQMTCAGTPVTLNGAGGVTYSWAPAADLSSPNASSTSATPATSTIYTLTVTDANNCQATDDVSVTVNALPNVNAGLDAAICLNQTHQMTGSGADSYVWSPATGLSATNIPNPVFSGTTSTSYALTGTDANGCVNTAAVMITVNPLPAVNAGADASICIGGSVQLNATGATNYAWSPSGMLNDPLIASPTFSGNSTTTLTLTGTDANGCANTDQIVVTVNPLPNVNAGNDASVCDGASVQLNASGAATYVWSPATDLNDPNIGNPIYSGVSDAVLTVTGTDVNGCVNTDNINLTVRPVPVVDAGNDATLCEAETMTLGASGAATYSWVPTTGLSNAGVAAPVLTASTTTTFTVTGTDAFGCTDTDQMTITVNPLPQAVINVIDDACLGNASFFGESSIGAIVSYAWTLGDNTTNTTASFAHTYTTVNNFPVTLTVVDNNGCEGSAASSAAVLPLPVVSFSIGGGADFCEGEVISFQNTSPGVSAGLSWNFTYQPGLPVSPGSSSSANAPQFSYQSHGNYTVRLLVLSDIGCVNSTTQPIYIHDTPIAAFDFNVVCQKSPTVFTDLSTVQGTSAINSWQWNYGNTSPTETAQNPLYVYPVAGTYNVELIVQSNQGCSDTVVNAVWVNPTPAISITATNVCEGSETQFDNQSTPQDATITSWAWNFGDGQTAVGNTAAHTYQLHGNYTVSLVALSDSGCTATGSTMASVYPYPETAFLVIDAEGCEPHTATFFNNSVVASGGIASYRWEFGNGEESVEASPVFTYTDTTGSFDITLSAISNQGCETVVVQQNAVTVHVMPVADFTQSDDEITVNEPLIVFTNASTDAIDHQWNFGNGSTSTATDPSATYLVPGNYIITLTVVNGMCSDSHESTLKVEPVFSFYIPNAFTPNKNGRNDVYRGYGEGYTAYQMSIYNRWGEQIFQSASDQEGWDGTYKGLPVQDGIYIYRFVVKDYFGNDHEYNGGVTLIR